MERSPENHPALLGPLGKQDLSNSRVTLIPRVFGSAGIGSGAAGQASVAAGAGAGAVFFATLFFLTGATFFAVFLVFFAVFACGFAGAFLAAQYALMRSACCLL